MFEKRKSPRQATWTPCTLYRMFSKGASVPSKVLNFSENGLMLELDYLLPRGTAVKVQFAENAAEIAYFGNTTCVGMVRWCVKQDGAFGGMYEVGVELTPP